MTQPFELLGMDLIGKLKTTASGNQYICVVIDYLTKWPQAYPLKTKSAEEVTQCLLKFIYQFEAPKRILSDQGKEFVNEVHICISVSSEVRHTYCKIKRSIFGIKLCYSTVCILFSGNTF